MSVFTPDPATLTQRLLDTPTPTPLSESIAADIGVQILVRALGVMRLHVSGFALNWAKVELFSSIPKAGLDEVYARTRAVLADRVALLATKEQVEVEGGEGEGEPNDNTPAHSSTFEHNEVLYRDLAQAIASQTVPAATVEPLGWGPESAWLVRQILLSLGAVGDDADAVSACDEEGEQPGQVECEHCRADTYTPWERVWATYTEDKLAAHVMTYHAPMARARRYLESVREGEVYACPARTYTSAYDCYGTACSETFASGDEVVKHILQAHNDDIGYTVPTRYMVPFIFEAAVEGKDGLQLLDELEMDSMLKWAEEEEAHNDAQQARRYEAYLERQGKAST